MFFGLYLEHEIAPVFEIDLEKIIYEINRNNFLRKYYRSVYLAHTNFETVFGTQEIKIIF